MANTRSAQKRNRQSEKRRARNQGVRTRVKTAVKKVRESLEQGEFSATQAAFHEAARVIDRASSKGVVHRNTASRKISRLAKAVAKTAPAK